MSQRAVIDVTHLQEGALDHRSPIWWANTLLLLIETTMFVLLMAAYLYVHDNFPEWPPLKSGLPESERYPDVLVPTLSLIILLVGIIPMYYADRAAMRMDQPAARRAGAVGVLLGLIGIAVRFFEFDSLHFDWNDNAYASLAWTLLGMHLLHQIVITAEDSFMLGWVTFEKMDHSHARDVRVTAIYWYWVALIYVPIYLLLYWSPRVL
ncbi:MAG TPA: cytochrome c oxidase subunit 3 [Rhodothermales bacterium]